MVIKGKTRGNGKALAYYLTAKGENERIEILEVDGNKNATRDDLIFHLTSWSLMSELTKSDKGLYHAVINPSYGDDRKMTSEDWNRAADILAKEAGFEGQRRAIVLHEKNGRVHGHVVYERYDHEKGIMITDSFNRLAQDRARQLMEKEFEHQITPNRNTSKEDIKRRVSELWTNTSTGSDFVSACSDSGYIVTRTAQSRAYSLVDNEGISYDLTRQIKGVRMKEIVQKLEGIKLQSDREVIKEIRQKQSKAFATEKMEEGKAKTAKITKAFANNGNDALPPGIQQQNGNEKVQTISSAYSELLKAKVTNEQLRQQKNEELAAMFSQSREDIVTLDGNQLNRTVNSNTIKQEVRERLQRQMEEIRSRNKSKNREI